jgi:hypothetical protein
VGDGRDPHVGAAVPALLGSSSTAHATTSHGHPATAQAATTHAPPATAHGATPTAALVVNFRSVPWCDAMSLRAPRRRALDRA